MKIQEAYRAIDAVALPNQAVFISVHSNWYDRTNGPRELSVEFRISLVPGFGCSCDQWTSDSSLEAAIEQCLAAVARASLPRATVDDAEAALVEATALHGETAEGQVAI